MKNFKTCCPQAKTKPGLTIGQHVTPSGHQPPVACYVSPDTFRMFEKEAKKMDFSGATCAPMVRSNYWTDQQAHSARVA